MYNLQTEFIIWTSKTS